MTYSRYVTSDPIRGTLAAEERLYSQERDFIEARIDVLMWSMRRPFQAPPSYPQFLLAYQASTPYQQEWFSMGRKMRQAGTLTRLRGLSLD